MTSPDAVLRAGKPAADLVQVLAKAKAAGNHVGLISNHAEPSWFDAAFRTSAIQFLQVRGRQSGEIIAQNAEKHSLNSFDVLVLATKDDDVQMGKNGGAILIAAGWSVSPIVKALGICIADAKEFDELVELTAGWKGNWWFAGDGPTYRVRALADLSGYGKSNAQQIFAQKLTGTVKNGGSRLNALLAVASRSLFMDGVGEQKGLVWGVYPSSNSDNDDNEVLSDFTHRLRTTVSRVRFCKHGEPLFIRHKPSAKRSTGGGGDRSNPCDQVTSIHLNPFYKDKGRLRGANAIVVDDCTTYGVSFGVAAAFLRAAGAVAVTGIALGKFGSQLRSYDIKILTDPFAPVAATGFTWAEPVSFAGERNVDVQNNLHALVP